MIVIGSNSEVAQAFVEKTLQEGQKFDNIYLLSSNPDETEKFARHILVKYEQISETIAIDLSKDIDFKKLEYVDSDLLFCAAGYLGKGSDEALYNLKNTQLTVDINYGKLVQLINYFAQKMEQKHRGTIIALSSVAGERGRQSNFMYGSAKAGFTAYLQGLRNYLYHRKVHVLSVIPGFMDTKMTQGMPLNPKLTASPTQAANAIYKAYKKQKNVAYVLPIWWVIMTVIKNIPEFLFKKLKM